MNNLHGLPSILGAVASAIVFVVNPNDTYDTATVPHTEGQAGYQIVGLAATLVVALVSGLISGSVVNKLVSSPRSAFVDDQFWEVADNFHKDL